MLAATWKFGLREFPGICLLVAGALVIAITLLARHELGIFHWIPMGLHLCLDALIGLTLLIVAAAGGNITPALFGAALLGLSLFTESYIAFSLRRKEGDFCRPDHSRESRL